ncbi:MAG: CPBP family intramembrane glutamic endopeptidase [Planctomycetota bacterium]
MESPAYHAAPMPTPPTPPPAAPPAAAPPPPPPARAAVPAPGLVRLAAGFYGITVLFAVGYALFSGTIRTLFGTQGPSVGHLLAAVGMGALVVGASHLAARASPVVDRAWQALEALLGPIDTRTALLLALFSGVAEELLFRGALWPHLGLAGTSLLFGLVHVLPRRALAVYPVFAAVVGLLFGLLREGSGSVLPPMIAHVVVNGTNLLLLARRPSAPTIAP